MTLGRIACAVGRHSIDQNGVKRAGGQHFGRCRCCKTPMIEIEPNHWAVQQIKDAGLSPRAFL